MAGSSASAGIRVPHVTRGDIDGFFGLALDNLVQLLLIVALCGKSGPLGFPDELLYGRMLPGVAVSLLVGNLFYAWQARRLAVSTGRLDVCALPYGINTVSLFAHVFLVMLPVKLAMTESLGDEGASWAAWRVGLVACLGSGVIELAGAPFAERLRKATPRAALLSTLAGIALGFISAGFLFRSFAHPIVGLTTFGVIMLVYFGRVKFRGGLPGGLIAVVLGTALAWATGLGDASRTIRPAELHVPIPVIGDLLSPILDGTWLPYLAVIVPMGLFNLIGSLQNIESAEAAGDTYSTAPSLAVNGIGSMAAAAFGSCFPTTIYIGHPGWKAMGARAGYSTLNGIFFTVICCTGLLGHIAWAIPIDAGMAIVLWIGIVITAQAFQATPREHAPAVVIGLLPALGAWAGLMAKAALRAGNVRFEPSLVAAFQAQDIYISGAFALEQGFIFAAMIWAAATVYAVERRFLLASGWCAVGTVLSAVGLMHGYRWTPGDTAGALNDSWLRIPDLWSSQGWGFVGSLLTP
ncbi:MAG: NCS2 family permease, partial [Deltaproteobacteria bacterium]|nr:NCS2 family permease [Deltaproteobacteria bacterium]